MLGDLLPLLQAVQPAELNATLTAIADGAAGPRRRSSGQTLVQLDRYLKQLNPHTKQLVDDLDEARPGRRSSTTASRRTCCATLQQPADVGDARSIEKRRRLDTCSTTATDTSNVIRSFLADNEQRLITVVGTSDKIYTLLAEYSPEYTCLFAGLNKLGDLRQQAIITTTRFNLQIVLDHEQPGRRTSRASSRSTSPGYGPNCFGLPDNPQPIGRTATSRSRPSTGASTTAPRSPPTRARSASRRA